MGKNRSGEMPTTGKSQKLKIISSVWLGKAMMALTRLLGRGGTTLPGRAALRLYPGLLPYLAGHLRHGSLLVTGTNGKTTTAALLTGILRKAGYRCIYNQSGSNMAWGVTSSLIGASSWGGKLPGDLAVMEVDEGAFPALVKSLHPRGMVLTNIFSDQLDRYGEIDAIQKAIGKGLEAAGEGSFQVINADDPSLAGIEGGSRGERWYFGLELELAPERSENEAGHSQPCPRCRQKLHYDQRFLAHLGRYRCPACGFKRPAPDVKLVGCSTRRGATALELLVRGEPLRTLFPLIGTYNLYNALAAATAAAAMGVPAAEIKTGLESAAPSFGRMERLALKGRSVLMALVKNAAGANAVLPTVQEQQPEIHLLAAINDKIADGTDVSWLWDVDFERLAAAAERIKSLTVTGLRAWDLAVRLKYAGLAQETIRVETDLKQALLAALERTPPGATLFVMPNYTAMLALRRLLNTLGARQPYWEGA